MKREFPSAAKCRGAIGTGSNQITCQGQVRNADGVALVTFPFTRIMGTKAHQTDVHADLDAAHSQMRSLVIGLWS